MTKLIKSQLILCIIACVMGTVGWQRHAVAANTFDWVGGTSGTWGDPTNWSPNTVPGGTDTARFNAATYTNQPTLAVGTSVGQILVTNVSGVVTIAGSTLTINATGVGNGAGNGIDVSAATALLTVSAPVNLGGSQSWSAGSGGISVSGIVGGAFALTKNGTGLLTLSGANTYTGGTLLPTGSLTLGSSSTGTVTTGPVGTGTLTLNGGTLNIPGGTTIANGMASAPATVSSIVLYSAGGSTTPVLSGTLTGTGTVNISSLNSGGSNSIPALSAFLAPFTGTLGFDTSHALFFPDLSALDGSAMHWVVTGASPNPGTNTTASYLFAQTASTTIKMGDLNGNGVIGANNTGATFTTWQVGALNSSTTFSGIFRDSLAAFGTGAASVTKVGTGALTLTGLNTYTGTTTISTGVLNAAGGSTAAPAGNLTMANVAGNAVLNVTGTMSGAQLSAGFTNGGNAAINLVPGGTLNITAADGGGNNDALHAYGAANGAYGALNMTGGTLIESRFQFGGVTSAAISGTGIGTISGGTVTSSGYMILARTGNSIGVVTLTGGTLNHVNATQNLVIGLSATATSRGELNINGGLLDNSSNSAKVVTFGQSGFTFTGRGVVNLNAGTLATNGIGYFTAGSAFINLNGGTLKAAASGTLLPTGGALSTYVNGPFGTFAGGAVIDTNSFTTTLAASLLTPPGSGISSLAVTTAGSGYIGAPYVAIAGTGVGATAIANMIDDGTGNATLKVGSFTITNPGVSYTGTPTFTLSGGGAAVAATPGAVTIGANVSGGLTKSGLGVLYLSGGTYTGATTVNAGGLGGTGTLASSVTYAAGTTVNPGASATPGRLTLANTSPLVVSPTTQLVFRLNGVAAASDVALTNTAVANNDSIDTSAGAVNMNGAQIGVTGTLAPGFYRLLVGGTFTGTQFTVVTAGGNNASLIFNANSIDVNVTSTGTFTWTGGGADANWMTAGNWGGTAPTGNLNEALIFPSSAAQQTNVNNFPNGTGFGSITYSGAVATTYITTSFDATHGAIALTGGGNVLQSVLTVASTNSLNVDLSFTNKGTINTAALNTLSLGASTGVFNSGGNPVSVTNAGTLQFNSATGQLGAGGAVVDNGTLIFNNSGAFTVSNAVGGTGSLTQSGAGTTSLTAANTYSGTTTVSGGTLSVNNGGSVTANVNVIITSGGTLDVTGGTLTMSSNAAGTFGVGYGVAASPAAGTGTVTVGNGGVLNVGTGGGRVFIGGSNNNGNNGTGILTITGTGAVNVAAPGAFPNDLVYMAGYGGAGTLNLNGGTLTLGRGFGQGGAGTFNFNGGIFKVNGTGAANYMPLSTLNVRNGGAIIDTNGFNITIANVVQHSNVGGDNATDGGLVKNGLGTLTLSNSTSFTGGTVANAGILAVIFTGNYNALSSPLTGSGTVNFSATVGAQITPVIPTVATFTGTLGFDTTNNFFYPIVTSGSLAKWVVNGGTTSTTTGGFLFAQAATVSLGELSGTGRVGAANANTVWSVGALNTSTTFSGMFMNNYLGGTTALTKVGSGTLTLSGTNTHSGNTTVSAGTLLFTNANTMNGSTIPAGGTLTISHQLALQNSTLAMNTGDTGTISFTVPAVTLGGLSGARNLDLGSVLVSIGNNNVSTTYSGNLTNGTGVTKVGTGTLIFSGTNTYAGPTLVNAGTLQLGGGTFPANLQLMPLGDSITDGVGANSATVGGYREGLYKLMASVPGFLLVGSATDTPGALPANEVHHEGHGGYRIDQIDGNLSASDGTGGNNGGFWLAGGGGTGRAAVTPDIILLHIGTNDISQGANNATMNTRLNTLLNDLVTLRPNANIIVADIIPMLNSGANTAAAISYNTNVVNMLVATYAGNGKHVTRVDMNTNFPSGGMSADGIHPNASGYQYMANQWYNAIQAVYPGSGSTAALPSSSPVTVALNATLNTNGTLAACGPLSGAGSVTLGGGSLTVTNTPGNDSLFSGVISGIGGQLIKQGAGGFTLTGTNTYTGLTSVNAGILIVNGSIATSSVATVAGGSQLRGTGTVPAVTTAAGTGNPVLWPGTKPVVQNLTGSTVETLTATSANLSGNAGKLDIVINNAASSKQVLQLTGTAVNTLNIDNNSMLSLAFDTVSGGSATLIVNITGAGGTISQPFLNTKVLAGSNTYGTNYSVLYHDSTGGQTVDSVNPTGGSFSSVNPSATGPYNQILVQLASVTPVTLDAFTAQAQASGVLVAWHCVSEYHNAGFNVYRRPIEGGEWSKVNPSLIAGRVTNPDGKTYRVYDWPNPGVYEYKLDSISISGVVEGYKEFAGPVTLDGSKPDLDVVSSDGIDAVVFSSEMATNVKNTQYGSAKFDALFEHASLEPRAQGSGIARSPGLARKADGSLVMPATLTVFDRISGVPIAREVGSIANATATKTSAVCSPLMAARWFTGGSVGTPSTFTGAKVVYSTPGVMLIPLASLPAGTDVNHLAIQREGVTMSALAVTPNGLLVYGQGYEDDYTNNDALFLRSIIGKTAAGQATKAQGLFDSIQTANVTSPATVTTSYHDVYFDYNTTYRPYTFTPWFSGQYLTATDTTGTMQSFNVSTPNASGSAATLSVNLWSLTQSQTSSPDHSLQVLVNGTPAGQVTWTGGNKMLQLTFQVPSTVLVAGSNKVDLVTPPIAGVVSQVSFLHSLTVNYTRTLDGSQPVSIYNTSTTSQLFELSNLPSANVWVVDARFPTRAALVPYETQVQNDKTFKVRFLGNAGGTGQFQVVPSGMENAPISVARVQVKPIKATGTYLATGPSQFGTGVQSLLMQRSKEGIRGQFVDQQQLFDYYNYGRYGPAGIQNAVRSTRPQYLLLVGRTIYDYKNYSRQNIDPLCPTFLVSTTFWAQTTSDAMFGDLGRGYPEVAVGRLPVTTTGELAIAVQHVLNYAGAPMSGVRVHAVTDQADPLAADFPAQATALGQSFPDMSWQANYLGVTYQTGPEVTTALQTAASGGADWVVYIGHGNALHLGNSYTILDTASVQQWKGDVVLLQSTCTANWMAKDMYDYKSIAIQALTQPQGGVSASIATSTYMNSDYAVPFMSQLMKNADAGTGTRWGNALMKTQQWAYHQGAQSSFYLDLGRTEQIFGDPAMPVFQKSKSVPTSAGKTGPSAAAPAIGTF